MEAHATITVTTEQLKSLSVICVWPGDTLRDLTTLSLYGQIFTMGEPITITCHAQMLRASVHFPCTCNREL